MEKNKRRRYRINDDVAIELGLKLNKNKRYRLTKRQEEVLLLIKEKQRPKILIYDIETSRMVVKTWWTGKQYIGTEKIIEEPRIISVAWKWLGDDEIYFVHWDMDDHNDDSLMEQFLEYYNRADLVIGQNNDKFDNRWLNARALKHSLKINTNVKSLDLMKQAKKYFRVPGYSMSFLTNFMGVEAKRSHEGILMWDMIEDGTPEQQREYMDKMIEYNVGDISSTEAMYVRMLPYIGSKTHLGVLMGKDKWSCPSCGGTHIKQIRPVYTAAGTLKHLMECEDCGNGYEISNKSYLTFLSD